MSKRQPVPGGVRRRRFTPEQLADIAARRAEGKSWKAIARELKRGHETLRAMYEEQTIDV